MQSVRVSVALAICAALLSGFASADAPGLPLSPPDIYPESTAPVQGEVTVQLVNNARRAVVHFTIDGTMPTSSSPVYERAISFFTPGNHTVRAYAVSMTSGRLDSSVVSRTYVVVPADVHPPVPHPAAGRYRGSVKIVLDLFDEANAPAGAVIKYVTGLKDPGDTWQTFKKGEPIPLETVGENWVQAFTSVPATTGGTAATKSPVAKYLFTITPPLLYDVSAECADCENGPVVGEYFSVWIQGAHRESRLFLSSVDTGCAQRSNVLMDTSETIVSNHQLVARFRVFAEPVRVFVCLSEYNAPYQLVQRRTEGASGDDHYSFRIFPSKKFVTRPPPTPKPPLEARPEFQEATSSFSVPMLLLLGAVLGVVVLIVRFIRHNHGPTARRAGAVRVSTQDDEEGEMH